MCHSCPSAEINSSSSKMFKHPAQTESDDCSAWSETRLWQCKYGFITNEFSTNRRNVSTHARNKDEKFGK